MKKLRIKNAECRMQNEKAKNNKSRQMKKLRIKNAECRMKKQKITNPDKPRARSQRINILLRISAASTPSRPLLYNSTFNILPS
jgi:hypothetical protein